MAPRASCLRPDSQRSDFDCARCSERESSSSGVSSQTLGGCTNNRKTPSFDRRGHCGREAAKGVVPRMCWRARTPSCARGRDLAQLDDVTYLSGARASAHRELPHEHGELRRRSILAHCGPGPSHDRAQRRRIACGRSRVPLHPAQDDCLEKPHTEHTWLSSLGERSLLRKTDGDATLSGRTESAPCSRMMRAYELIEQEPKVLGACSPALSSQHWCVLC